LKLNKLEKDLLDKPWQQARAGVEVKLLPQGGELYVLAQPPPRITITPVETETPP